MTKPCCFHSFHLFQNIEAVSEPNSGGIINIGDKVQFRFVCFVLLK